MVVPSRPRLVAVVVGAVVLLGGAAVAVSMSATDPRLGPPRLAAEIDHWYRTDEAAGVLPVLVRNAGDEPVTITRLDLVAPSVVTRAETVAVTVRPGLLRRVRLPLLPARCPERGDPSPGRAAVVATVESSGGAFREVRLPARDPENVLGRSPRRNATCSEFSAPPPSASVSGGDAASTATSRGCAAN